MMQHWAEAITILGNVVFILWVVFGWRILNYLDSRRARQAQQAARDRDERRRAARLKQNLNDPQFRKIYEASIKLDAVAKKGNSDER